MADEDYHMRIIRNLTGHTVSLSGYHIAPDEWSVVSPPPPVSPPLRFERFQVAGFSSGIELPVYTYYHHPLSAYCLARASGIPATQPFPDAVEGTILLVPLECARSAARAGRRDVRLASAFDLLDPLSEEEEAPCS
jgi:hypothetical protein